MKALACLRLPCLLIIFFVYGCGQSLPQLQTPSPRAELGAILGPVTKAKVLDRFKGYPICGMLVEEQKQTLKVRVYPLFKRGEQVQEGASASINLIEVECFFFGVQGLYEFAILTTQDGALQPLSFEGAEPVKQALKGSERRSPVALNEGRYEVCGVPQFDASSRALKVTCKDPNGGCGAYAHYTLQRPTAGDEKPPSRFKLKQARFKSCGDALNPDIERWSDITP